MLETSVSNIEYQYDDAEGRHSHSWLLPALEKMVSTRIWSTGATAFDYGCGNGVMTNWLCKKGFKASGVDISTNGIAQAKAAFPDVSFSTDTSAQHVAALGPFDLALCTDVIAHCPNPFVPLTIIFDNLKPGGLFLLTTPYYGYW
jgi:2-polyprenyl-6-hydroxyphenyl methylase/3-demethylubiquinone-9 3-methyltransferase